MTFRRNVSGVKKFSQHIKIQDKFGTSLAAIYMLASKNAIPKKKEGVMVSYSKKHFDIAKGIAQPDEPQYYTVAEAMAKFNLTRDQLYHYAKITIYQG